MKKRYPLRLLALLLTSPALHAQICQPDNIPATTPSSRFTVNTNSTVTDKQTGLMWKQCSEGQSGAGCATGNPVAYTWQGALQQAQTVNIGGFAGYQDWRLPNLKELHSIVERQCHDPAINTAVFPNNSTLTNLYFWSSTSNVNYSRYAWVVSLATGDSRDGRKYLGSHVLLVRSGQ